MTNGHSPLAGSESCWEFVRVLSTGKARMHQSLSSAGRPAGSGEFRRVRGMGRWVRVTEGRQCLIRSGWRACSTGRAGAQREEAGLQASVMHSGLAGSREASEHGVRSRAMLRCFLVCVKQAQGNASHLLPAPRADSPCSSSSRGSLGGIKNARRLISRALQSIDGRGGSRYWL